MARQYATYYLGDEYFGVEVKQVQEVLRYQEMTRVPLSSPVIRGLINLRGQIVLAVDLRRRLGLPDRPEGALPMNVVLQTDDGAVSLLVDRIGDVITVADEDFELPPENLRGVSREIVRGVFKLDGALLLVVDPARVLDFERRAETLAA